MTTKASIELRNFYQGFDSETSEFLKESAQSIKQDIDSASEIIVGVGKKLLAVKEQLPHGEFGEWLKLEMAGYSHQTFNNWMNVAKEFGDENPNGLENFSARALYAASAKSTPPEVRKQALQMSQDGKKVTPTTVEALKVAVKVSAHEPESSYRYVYTGTDEVMSTTGEKDVLLEGDEIRYREGGNGAVFAYKPNDKRTIYKIAKDEVKAFPIIPVESIVTASHFAEYGTGIVIADFPNDPSQVLVRVDEEEDITFKCFIEDLTVVGQQGNLFTSVEEELENQAESLGLPTGEQTLPEVERNQGDPTTLQPRGMDAVGAMGAMGAMAPAIEKDTWVCRTINYKKIVRQIENYQCCFPDCGQVLKIKNLSAHCKWNSGLVDQKIPINQLSPLPDHLQGMMNKRMDAIRSGDFANPNPFFTELELEQAICKYLGDSGDQPFVINPNADYFKTKVLGGYRVLFTRECPPSIIPEIIKADEKDKISRAIILLSINFVQKQANVGAFQKTLGLARRVLWPQFYEDLLILNFDSFDPNASPYGCFIDCFKGLGAWGSFNPND